MDLTVCELLRVKYVKRQQWKHLSGRLSDTVFYWLKSELASDLVKSLQTTIFTTCLHEGEKRKLNR